MADTNPQHVVDEPRASLFSNIVAIVGLIILIVIVIWGLLHLAGLSKNWFSGIFPGSTPKVTVTAPKDADSGKAFNVSWKYSTDEKGNFAFLYQCRAGLSLKNAQDIAIPCGAAYTVGSGTSMALTPTLSGSATSSLPITILFLPSATSSKQAQGSAVVTVHAPGAQAPVVETETPVVTTAPVTTPATPKPVTPATNTTYSGPADLSVRVIAVGVIDPYSGAFVNRAPMYPGDIAAAQFDISNVGGSWSSYYYFSASLPTMTGYSYVSPPQSPLAPGSHVVNTLRWSEAVGGSFSVVISTPDADPSNNYSSQWLSGGYNAQPNYYQY